MKPQAWFDSPAIRLPATTPPPPAPAAPADGATSKRQDEQPADDSSSGEVSPIDVTPPPPGSFITPEGVTSTFEVTEKMLADANFARLEHVTVRVWIEHQRRGDVYVSLKSPNGIVSTLAAARPWDEANTGFPGWKFMTLKHW